MFIAWERIENTSPPDGVFSVYRSKAVESNVYFRPSTIKTNFVVPSAPSAIPA